MSTRPHIRRYDQAAADDGWLHAYTRLLAHLTEDHHYDKLPDDDPKRLISKHQRFHREMGKSDHT